MIPARNDTHVDEGLELLTSKYRDKPIVRAILASLLARVQVLEEDLWQVLWGWVLTHYDHTASGQQLDDLGAIVGQPREGRSDADYLTAIRLRIRINRSKGRSEDVLQVAKLIDPNATYVEGYPLGFEVSIYNVTNGGDIVRMLAQTKAATSYGVLLTSSWDATNVFSFEHAGLNNQVFGSVTAVDPDRRFPAALPTNPAYRTYVLT